MRSPFLRRFGMPSPFLDNEAGFSPAILFAASEPGVWYDPSDLSTMFQDTAGTIPVTTPGQTVALALDKSKGLTLGPELVTNGDFSSGGSDWTLGVGWAISGGEATLSANSGALTQTVSIVAGRTYRVQFTLVTAVTGTFRFRLGATTPQISASLGAGAYTYYLTAGSDTSVVSFSGLSTTSYTIDNISVRELPGNHATQATVASRPTYGVVPATGRRNLLTYTEDLTNGVWTAINGTTKNSALNFTFTATNSRIYQSSALASGATYTLSVRFSDTDVGKKIRPTFFDSVTGWSLLADTTIPVGGVVTRTFTMSNAGTFVGFQAASDLSANTSFTLVAGQSVQLETGSTATNYQRVGSQFDVTEAGVPSLSYLSFDGVDDFLQTPTITPGTDKVQVFAGVRKLRDVPQGVVAETGTTTGVFGLAAPRTGNGRRDFGWFSIGTVFSSVTSGDLYPAPINAILTGLSDISGDLATLRINGSQVAQSTSDQGTGNFLAYPIYIGLRGGTTLPFSGNIYSLIVRFGTNLDAGTITSTETWVNGKTGAY